MFAHTELFWHQTKNSQASSPSSISYVLSSSGGQEEPRARQKQRHRSRQRGEKKTIMEAVARSSLGMAGKKARKPYTITRPRERWSADEHDRFLHALVLFGRDWKRIEAFVVTKTSTQIRSHAQKHFLKAQKLGIVTPPPHPRRAAVLAQSPASCPATYAGDSMMPSDETLIQLPLSPDDAYFAQVYRFVGDIFGSDAPQSVEDELQRLLGADPVIVDTILQVLENLQENMYL